MNSNNEKNKDIISFLKKKKHDEIPDIDLEIENKIDNTSTANIPDGIRELMKSFQTNSADQTSRHIQDPDFMTIGEVKFDIISDKTKETNSAKTKNIYKPKP